jgi:hypothetical protein
MREDILWIRGLDVLTEYPSFRHFGGRGLPGGYLPLLWPGPRRSVEANLDRLRALPIPEVAMTKRPSELVTSLAKAAARERPDRTNTPLGRVLRRARLLRKVDAAEARAQTDVLVPLAIAHASALLRMFARDAKLEAAS